MKRFTRPTHKIHPSQEEKYIISNAETVRYEKGESGIITINGPAINMLGRYEDLGTLEEVREAVEYFRTKK